MHRTMSPPLIVPAALLLAAMAALIGGCAAQSKPQNSGPYRIDRTLTAAANLERFASLEETSSGLQQRDVPPPPGLEPQLLAPREESDTRAFLQLEEALRTLASGRQLGSAVAEQPADEPDPVAQTAAQRHYVRGREAALAGRHYQAITEFHRGLELDPEAAPLLRELARSHFALGNQGKATEFYTRVLRVDPANGEALFTLALAAAHRREWEQAAAMLASWYTAHQRPFDHDPGAEAISQFTLGTSLRALGYDRAHLEASRNAASELASFDQDSMYAALLASIGRQQSELWRGVGDAHCRLGEYADALEAYAVASVLPAPDPTALHPRVIYANLRLGRVYTAQHEMLAVLRGQRANISDRDIRLSAYIADHVNDRSLLQEEATRMYREQPSEPALARVAAALLDPDAAAELLREFIARSPRDVRVAGQLLVWLGSRNLAGAVEIAATLIESQPDLAGEYVTRLVFATPRPANIIEHARHLASPSTAANIEARVLVAMGALGEAWSIATEAQAQMPRDRTIHWLRIELAALLEEPAVLHQVLDVDQHRDDPITWMFRSRAMRSLLLTDDAIDAAQRAIDLAQRFAASNDDLHRQLLLDLALAHHAHAARSSDEYVRMDSAHQAAQIAVQVLEDDPMRDAAYELLIALYRPGGMIADNNSFRQIAEQLLEVNPDSRLYARLSAEELIEHGRNEQALERLINLYDSDVSDTNALRMAIQAWIRSDQLDAAVSWISSHLKDRPGDPALLEQWVGILLQQNRADEVITTLSERLDQEPRDFAAARLLESAYRATGQVDLAFDLGEKRLLAQPQGVRRDIELAALYGGAGFTDRAFGLLHDVTARLDNAQYQHLLTAISILNRISTNDRSHAELAFTYAVATVERFPESPLQVYGIALRALAQLDRMDDSYEELATQAARHAHAAEGMQTVMQWRDLAQALISEGYPEAAARALRPLIFETHLHQPPASDALAIITFAADAASSEALGRSAESVTLIEDLAAIGRLPRMPGTDPTKTPTIASTLYDVSQIYSLLGNQAGVQTLLSRAFEYAPKDAMILNNLGFIRIEQGDDSAQTIEWIERAFQLAPDTSHILDTIGWLRYLQGVFQGDPPQPDDEESETRGALEFIEAAIDAAGEPIAEVHDHLGDTYWRLGRHEDAITAWETAASLLDDPDARRETIQNLHILQTRGWGVLVADPRVLYDRLYGEPLLLIRAKLNAAKRGDEPPVAATFAEQRPDRSRPQAAADK